MDQNKHLLFHTFAYQLKEQENCGCESDIIARSTQQIFAASDCGFCCQLDINTIKDVLLPFPAQSEIYHVDDSCHQQPSEKINQG